MNNSIYDVREFTNPFKCIMEGILILVPLINITVCLNFKGYLVIFYF